MMKVQVRNLTGQEREKIILLYTKKAKMDFDKLSDLNNSTRFNDDIEIDLYFEYKNEIISIQEITIEKNNTIRKLFHVLILDEEDNNTILPYHEFYEIIDDSFVYIIIDEERPLQF
jgi:hypothetical protein